ncbi:glucosaminidase domain-containing protein [Cohnella nanjingensis]|uniref:Glucosaminidase domain-containing protein n=1 Tax=Cohnella nanjingensis TaxID=1387779 RepID=A0A7X0RS51_9BACL|nr:glucosaminidase domain-containing protein [Cohnella nanjingensis]MBB6672678.1 glucosaminidase domain-containing protein [Cohnella nanjingensis]
MRRLMNRYLFVSMLSVTLLLTLGMNVLPSHNGSEQVDAAAVSMSVSSPAAQPASPSPAASDSPGASSEPASPSSDASPAATDASSPKPTPAPAVAPAPTGSEAPAVLPAPFQPTAAEPAPPPQPTYDTYEVTAYFLNVRTNPYAKSKILNVVEKGTLLQVVGKTDEGWLRLRGEGYVHGGYAKLVPPSGASLPQSEGEKPASQPPQPKAPKLKIGGAKKSPPAKQTETGSAAKPGKPTSTVKSDSGLTAEHIAKIFEGTALADKGLEDAILEIEDDYGINAFFTIAVMKLESGNGSSKLAKTKNNLFGLNAVTGNEAVKAFSFKTKGDSVRKFGQLLAKNYVGKGYTTIEKVAKKYCPANSKWATKVKNIMSSDHRKI